MRCLLPIALALLSTLPGVERLRVVGTELVDADDRPVALRGVNWGWWDTAQPGDAAELATLGGRVVRMPLRWYFNGEKSDQRQTGAPGHIRPEGLAKLEEQLDRCAAAGIWVVFFAGSDRGAGDDKTVNFWTSPELRQEFIEMWTFLAARWRERPYLAAYELLSEPHPVKAVGPAGLRAFYGEVLAAVRALDPNIPVLVGADDHYDINLLESAWLGELPNVFYTANFYLPTAYAKQEPGDAVVSYPGNYVDPKGISQTLNLAHLTDLLRPALEFRQRHLVPVFINQVGVRSRVPGALDYTRDVLELFDRERIGWTWWTWRTSHKSPDEHGLYWWNGAGWQRKDPTYAMLADAFGRHLGRRVLLNQPPGHAWQVLAPLGPVPVETMRGDEVACDPSRGLLVHPVPIGGS